MLALRNFCISVCFEKLRRDCPRSCFSSGRNNVSAKVKMARGKYRFQFMSLITMEYSMDLLLEILAYNIPWMGFTIKYNILCFNIKEVSILVTKCFSFGYFPKKERKIQN